jgi:hypothetical protein
MLALGTVASCGDGSAAHRDDKRTAGVYAAVVLAVADGQLPNDKTSVVFVAPRPDTKPIPIEVQAAVVDDLTGHVAVRFVDDTDEAVDSALPGRPVKAGVLVRLGPVPPTGDPVEMTADRYRTETDQATLTLSARSGGASWSAEVLATTPLASGR